MKPTTICVACAIATFFTANSLPAAAAPLPRLEAACLQQAQWPITTSHIYRNAAVTTRQAMLNAYNPDVTAMKKLCVESATGTPAADLTVKQHDLLSRLSLRYGPESATPVTRLSVIYADLLQTAAQ